MQLNPYEILGVSADASASQIKDAYRDLVKKFHPDRNPSPNAHEMIAQINAAYDILSGPEKRATFDSRGKWYEQTIVEDEDPREVYRREYLKRKKEETIRDQAKNEAALQRMYKGSWWMATAAMLFCLFLILDYHLPTLHVDEVAKYGTQERGPRSKYRQGDLISLMATEHFMFVVPHKVHLDYDYFADNKEALHIEATRMLKIPRNVSLNLNGQHVSFEVEDTICTRGLASIVYVVVVLAVIMLVVRRMNRKISEMISVPVNLMTISIILGYFVFGGH